ncbi:uncharacterized protein SCHCODRAFT_02449730, partial [Schizophyllum commune H4-8]|uniref:uncharacterized protein n=1 Tax=Schizophyllum commune (strain H4-8 / FGSC 9210) TaxID=578458 RepID=UPI00216108B3
PGNDEVPRIQKDRFALRKRTRRLYATFAVGDGEYKRCDLEVDMHLDFTARPASTLRIQLFAEHRFKADERIATQQCSLDTLLNQDGIVQALPLESCSSALSSKASLALTVTARCDGDVDAIAMAAPLTVSDKWATMERYVRRVVKIGTIAAEVNPISKAVLALLQMGVDVLGTRIERNEAILCLIDETSAACKVTLELDEPEYEDQRAKQREAREALVLQIYCALTLISEVGRAGIGDRTSRRTSEQVKILRQKLQLYTQEVHLKGHLDTQTAVFRVERLAQNIFNKEALEHLPYARHIQAGTSRSCLPGTRTTVLREIQEWVFNPDGQRALFLHGVAGAGKSAVAHSAALQLKNIGVLAPFFAFDNADRDRAAHQLIPTWALQLAYHSKSYHDNLCALDSDVLSTLDIRDQFEQSVTGPLSNCSTSVPIVFIIDALDECPYSDEADASRSAGLAAKRRALLEILRDCLGDEIIPRNIRFLITSRPDRDIQTYLASRVDFVRFLPIDDTLDTEGDIRLFVGGKLAHTPAENLADDVVHAAQNLFECA